VTDEHDLGDDGHSRVERGSGQIQCIESLIEPRRLLVAENYGFLATTMTTGSPGLSSTGADMTEMRQVGLRLLKP
jgi:hypothetical protein